MMPTAVSYPGVYIEEVSSGVRTITGVATSITAFVGSAPQGPSNKPIRIQSMAAFTREFGNLNVSHPMGYAVSQFFDNGGTDAVVVRVLSEETATVAKFDINGLKLEARHKGQWANNLRFHIDHNTRAPDQSKFFNLFIQDSAAGAVEEFRNLSVESANLRFYQSVLESESNLVRTDMSGDAPSPPPAKRPAPHLDPFDPFGADFKDLRFKVGFKVTDEFVLKSQSANGNPVIADGDLLVRIEKQAEKRFTLYLKNKKTGFVETLRSLSLADEATFKARVAKESKLVEVDTAPKKSPDSDKPVPAPFTTTVFSFEFEKEDGSWLRSFSKVNTEGNDGLTPIIGSDIVGDRDDKTGIYALEDADLFNLLCIPPPTRGAEVEADTVYNAALTYCQERRAMLLVDSPAKFNTIGKAETGVDTVRAALGGVESCKNAAMFFPQIRAADPDQENRTAEFVPCGAVAGIFAKTDAQRGVWKAPAGIEAGIGGVREFSVKMTDPENGRLNQLGLNCLRNFPVYGNLVWGSRTLAGADALASEHKYIPVRRLTLFIEESLYRGTQWVVFEPNDEPLWAQIRLNVGVFMQGLFRQGAFQGRTANEAFFVKCDKTTTTQADINLGKVNIDVGFAPLKPAEFVIIRIQQIVGDLGV